MRFIEEIIDKEKKHIWKVINNADIIIGILLLVSGISAFFLGFKLGADRLEQVSLILISATVLFFIFRGKFPKSIESLFSEGGISKTKFLLISIIFFSLFIFSVLIINQDLYGRPLSFLVIISIITGLIAVQIVSTTNKRDYYLILFEIIILGILVRASVFYQFYGYIGGDPWSHAWSITLITDMGHVTEEMKGYSNFPFMHLFITSAHYLTGLDIKNSMFIAGLSQFLSFTFIYLVVKEFLGDKIGLLSFLILAVATYPVGIGFLIIPQSFGITYVVIVIYLVFIQKKIELTYKKIVYTIFTILFLTGIIFTHTIDSFAALIILLAIFSVDTFKMKVMEIFGIVFEKKMYVTLTLIVFFSVFVIYYWMYSSGMMGVVGDSLKWGLSASDQAPAVSTIMESFTTTAMKMLPLYLFSFLALIGTLFTLKIKNFKTISLYGWLVILFVFISVFLSLNSFLPARWFIYVMICLIVPVVLAVMSISQISPRKVTTVFLLVILISFMWLTSYDANAQNVNPFTPGPTQGMKYSEMNIGILDDIPSSIKLYIDLGHRLPSITNYNVTVEDASRILSGNGNLTGIILVRKDLEHNPFSTSALGGGHFSVSGLDRLFLDKIEKENRIYDSGTVTAFEGGI
ncbi:MAG: hypothetical protein HZC47_08160 [Methanobacterium sp.]|uniref:hypothetical protein n=1 Tax=Methanobacterium sp. TaxID=2164 RepID=UPI003D653084|nr:hypothetical protein [Methanobacterium sp.]